jgi:hypothetical protein
VALATGAVVLVSLALGGCSGSSGSGPAAPTTSPSEAVDSGTALDDVDTLALVVRRGPFCDQVDPAAVTRALGEQPGDASAYRSGQRIRITDDVADVVHEFGCRWTAGDSSAEAWVFAPPITRKRAAVLARHAGGKDCRDDRAPGFGRSAATCASSNRDAVSMTFSGLFGDAWLSCSLTLAKPTGADLPDRASRWCAAVVTGAAH